MIYLITSATIGKGDDELGLILTKSFFHTLAETDVAAEEMPQKVIFLNSGVKLVAKNSPILNSLTILAGKGVELLACGTCLDFFNLKEQVEIGQITNMFAIQETIICSEKVVTI